LTTSMKEAAWLESKERRFDMNIEKILEGWETCHAVREVIANPLDEQVLMNTKDAESRRSQVRVAYHPFDHCGTDLESTKF
jgi:hypothetical protein